MSPEQAAGKPALIGPASDIYSLGAILYACLAGRAPFVADSPVDTLLQVMQKAPVSPRELNPAVPKDLETICLKCLNKEPHKRYGTAQELADDLARYLGGRPVLARPVGAISRAVLWCRRNKAVATLVGLLFASLRAQRGCQQSGVHSGGAGLGIAPPRASRGRTCCVDAERTNRGGHMVRACRGSAGHLHRPADFYRCEDPVARSSRSSSRWAAGRAAARRLARHSR